MRPKARPSRPASAAATDHPLVGDRVIELCSVGKSFASIAASVGLERSLDAFGAFVAAVATKSPAEQTTLRAEENTRLDELERRIQQQPEGPIRDRRIASVRKLRLRLSPA